MRGRTATASRTSLGNLMARPESGSVSRSRVPPSFPYEATHYSTRLLHPSFSLLDLSHFVPRESTQKPLVVGVVLHLPLAHRSRHYVQVVEVVAWRRGDGVVASGHKHGVVVPDSQRLVERAVLRVDLLDGEALYRLDLVVVGLFQVTLVREGVLVVLVRRVARPVPVRCDDLNHQQPFGWTVLHQDRVYTPLRLA